MTFSAGNMPHGENPQKHNNILLCGQVKREHTPAGKEAAEKVQYRTDLKGPTTTPLITTG